MFSSLATVEGYMNIGIQNVNYLCGGVDINSVVPTRFTF